MEVLRQLAKSAINISQDELFVEFFNQKVIKDFIVELNTRGQLWTGIDATGKTLESIGGSYSFKTINLKRQKGLPVDRVTLFDTGAFYRSFEAFVNKNGIELDANLSKNGHLLSDRWGKNLIGLTNENLQEVIDGFKEFILEAIEKKILALV